MTEYMVDDKGTVKQIAPKTVPPESDGPILMQDVYKRQACLLITTCFFAATSLFFAVYPETAKAVNICLSSMISTFKTDGKDGYPLGSSIPDATVQEGEAPVQDVTTNGYGTTTSGSVEKNLQNGLEELPEQDGSHQE